MLETSQNVVTGFLRQVTRGKAAQSGLPARILHEIDKREAAAERLISWVQLLFVLFFAALYSLAPRAEGASGDSFVPATLAAYLAFTLIRIVLAYRGTLPGWVLILSIVVDVMLLCGLIFSFHIQYGQHPAFYLKAPTLMYLFIFIGLRTLRVDPRYVLITGLVAAAGWMGLVAYALTSDMGGLRITRDYTEYLTSNAILIGAEVDKTLVILAVTAILTLALYRGRQVLYDAIQSEAAATDLRRFFAPEVAVAITASDTLPASGRGEVRRAAILFVDVRGFTLAAQSLPPARVLEVLAVYQDIATTEIERHGGRIDKFLGDGILATFGAVQDSETYAADGVRSAIAVIGALDSAQATFAGMGWPGVFRTGAAVASGSVTVGVVGSRDRLEFTVIGHAVNLAAKMEGANKDQDTCALTDTQTYAEAMAQGYDGAVPESRPLQAVPGVPQPLDLVVLA